MYTESLAIIMCLIPFTSQLYPKPPDSTYAKETMMTSQTF